MSPAHLGRGRIGHQRLPRGLRNDTRGEIHALLGSKHAPKATRVPGLGTGAPCRPVRPGSGVRSAISMILPRERDQINSGGIPRTIVLALQAAL